VDYPLLSFPAANDWLLYPSYDDKTFMNNVLTEEIFRAMGLTVFGANMPNCSCAPHSEKLPPPIIGNLYPH
jgi:hypothetical protein